MSCQFSTTDKDNVQVSCSHDTWDSHIAGEHLEMVGQQLAVESTVRDPAYEYKSGRYPDRRLFYKPFVLPGPFHRTYLLVVVGYRTRDGFSTGSVITAFSTANMKQGYILIWSKY